MAPRLYTASVVGEGVPVDEIKKVEPVEKVKKPRQKKVKVSEPLEAIPEVEGEDGANVSKPTKPSNENKPDKEKKPRTEKQIAAAERMVEARRLKKEAKEKEAAEAAAKAEEEKKKIADKEAAKEAKKEAAKEKRRLSKLMKATSGNASTEEHSVEPAEVPVVADKPVKRKANDDAPPKWLPTLISAIKAETGHTGSAKKLKEESHAEAAEKWSDPLVRDRVSIIHNKAGEQVTNALFPGRTFVRR